MRFSLVLSIASLASVALALPGFAAAAGGGQQIQARGEEYKPTIHKVTVGKGGLLRYDPEYICAKKGDAVEFKFFPMNHTVSQSSFASPCTKLESPFNSNVDIGIDSSFNFATTDPEGGPVFAFTIQSEPDVPLWFYCRQTVKVPHCKNGMVFAINPPKTGNTFDKFLALAKAS